MTEQEFRNYLGPLVQGFAEDQVNAGVWDSADALEKSRQTIDKLLTSGLATQNHWLTNIVDDELGARVGVLWFMVEESSDPSAFIYDLGIHEEFRRKGYGRRALLALDEELRRKGVCRVSLHVFARNTAARSLYEQAGYVNTGMRMLKQLGARLPAADAGAQANALRHG
jgi:ribosomal protein S18 acetylase RimI-like enzyme